MTRRFYFLAIIVILLIAGGYFFSPLYHIGLYMMWILLALTAFDLLILYIKGGITAGRSVPERLSLGDENNVTIRVDSRFFFNVKLEVIDEIPPQLQLRNVVFKTRLKPHHGKNITYKLRPVSRGEYDFGNIRVSVSSPVGLFWRRMKLGHNQTVKVYPSFQMLHQYELLAISNRLTDLGIKRIRRAGHNTEYEQIKAYVTGDDFRTVNWAASARRHELMVNVYQDERSQQVISIIDKGRMMQQAFGGMTLLDYSINAALMLSFVAMNKDDKAGLITFDNNIDTCLIPSRRHGHLQTILEQLYVEKSTFSESDFSMLSAELNLRVSKRSLILLFTNMNSLVTLKREQQYISQIARKHKLIVVFFRDTDINSYLSTPSTTSAEYYQHVSAEKAMRDEELIAATLRRQGVDTVLAEPNKLTVDVVNKYLEVRGKLA